LLLVALGLRMMPRRNGMALAALGAFIACAGMALSGHVAALVPAWPAQAALMLHTVTAAFWLGSLWPLWLAMRDAPASQALIHLRRFSMIAVPAVAVLVFAGTGVALTRIAEVEALMATGYGRILAFKLGFVVLMIAVALRNRRLTRHRATDRRTAAELARNVRIEIGCAGAVLLLTAVLGHTAPGTGAPADGHHDHAPAGATLVIESQDLILQIALEPGRVGANRIAATLTDAAGRLVVPRELTIALSLPAGRIEPLIRTPTAVQGIFVVETVELPLAGLWHVRVDALVSDFEKITFAADLDIL
jgi:copper transport protein